MLTSYDLKSCTRPLTICTVASYSLIKHPSILYNKNYYLFFLTFLYDNKGRKSYLTTVHYTLYTIHYTCGCRALFTAKCRINYRRQPTDSDNTPF